MINRRLRTLAWVATVAVSTIGCQTVAGNLDQPARITSTSDASRSDLQGAVNAALSTEVVLADDALTDTSLLIIEVNPPKSIDGVSGQGRIMATPIQFRLVINGTDCILIDQRDESRYLLEKTSCVAE
jgi:hypothetical protein